MDSYKITHDENERNEDNERKVNIFNVDYSTVNNTLLHGFDMLKIFDDLKFEDSRQSVGLQVVDLLVSNINRTLKHNCDDINVQAALLGGLTVNTPDENMPNIPVLIFDNALLEHADIEFDALAKMTEFSYPLYNDIYRKNYRVRMNEMKEMIRVK